MAIASRAAIRAKQITMISAENARATALNRLKYVQALRILVASRTPELNTFDGASAAAEALAASAAS